MKPDFELSMRLFAVRALRLSAAVALPLSVGACTWFTDFKNQPRIEPWEPMSQKEADSLSPPRGQPMYSVPVQGTVSPGFAVSYTPAPATLDSLSPIPNPNAADARSLENGKKNYQINCAVCHGMAGDGNGTIKRVNPAYGWSPSLMTAQAKGHPDGYIYGMMRNGRGAMPSYNRIEEPDRWDVVNYLRALQAGTADTALIGYPGQNGNTVPGPSRTAPNVPSRYVHPTVQLTPGSSGINSATFRSKNEGMGVRALHGEPHTENKAAGTATSKAPGDSKEKHE